MNVTNVFLIILFAKLYCLLVKIWLTILYCQVVNVNKKRSVLDCFDLMLRESARGSSFGQVSASVTCHPA